MDIRDRVMGDKPDSFLHKIAGIVPGFNGYMDRERRRDADKLLRTYLAHQYSAQRDRLNRAQQGFLRAHQMDNIAEVDRLTGVLQRFVDRLNTATYGYSGLFDPVKVEAQDLDQLYAFDMALTNGVDTVSSGVGDIETALQSETATKDVRAALTHLSSVLDDLNLRLNQRGDLLSTGRGLDTTEYNSLLSGLNGLTGAANAAGAAGAASTGTTGTTSTTGTPDISTPPAGSQTASASTGAQPQYTSGTAYPGTGAPTVNTSGSGERARFPGEAPADTGAQGTMPEVPRYPTGESDATGTATTDLRGEVPDYNVKTASSPSAVPTDHASDIAGDLPSGGSIDNLGLNNSDIPGGPETKDL